MEINYPAGWSSTTAINSKSSIFAGCTKLTSITVPEGVTAIPANAFSGSTNFVNISLPSTLESLGSYAFYGCTNLSGISLPSGLSSIAAGAFLDCCGLTSVTVPDAVTSIGTNAFSGCTGLIEIRLPNVLETIDEYAFSGCTGLTKVELPNSVKALNRCAFYNCSSLMEINYPAGWSSTTAINSKSSIFAGCTKLTSITVPEGVTKIPAYAFSGCKYLRLVRLPTSLQYISNNAFYACDGFTGIEIPNGTVSLGQYAYGNCINLRTATIPSSVADFGTNVFYNCSKLSIRSDMDSFATMYAIDHAVPYIPTSDSVQDDGALCLDRSKTYYSANQLSLSAVGTIDFNLDYAFKSTIASAITNAVITIRIPLNTTLINSTLRMDGQAITSFENENNLLSIPVNKTSGSIRFSLKPTSQTDIISYAQISFENDGVEKKEIIGIENNNFPFITIDAEEEINTNEFTISGIAPAGSSVGIYLDDALITTASASKAGQYTASVRIDNPIDYHRYTLKAVINDSSSSGAERTIKYSSTYPRVESFVMDYNGVQYDLTNTDIAKPIITFVPGKQMSFDIKFDNPAQISQVCVVSERNNVKKYLDASWDENKQSFVATGFFDPENTSYVPGVITVEYAKVKPSVIPGDAVDFSSELFRNSLPNGADESQVQILSNTASKYEANVLLAGELGELVQDELKMVITSVDKEYGEDISGLMNGWEDFLAYFVSGYDDEKYILNIDYTDPAKLTILVHDITSNKLITAVLEYADDAPYGGSTTLFDVIQEIDAVSKATGVFVDMYEIESDDAKLREKIWASDLSYDEKIAAEKKADELKRDRESFVVLTTIITIATMTAVSAGGAPALLFSVLLGAITTASSFFWDARMSGILSGGSEFSASWRWKIDPSGYVFDSKTEEKLQDVTVSAYWIPYDGSDDFWIQIPENSTYGTLWDASEWGQLNPMRTDAEGFYSWDVPEGWWRVKYEKDGYVTVWSDWMTVPPIQTDVNIGMMPTVLADYSLKATSTSATETTVVLSNNSEKTIDVLYMLAAYNEVGKMVACNSIKCKLVSYQNTALTVTYPSDANVTCIKAIILDLDQHLPLRDVWVKKIVMDR